MRLVRLARAVEPGVKRGRREEDRKWNWEGGETGRENGGQRRGLGDGGGRRGPFHVYTYNAGYVRLKREGVSLYTLCWYLFSFSEILVCWVDIVQKYKKNKGRQVIEFYRTLL